MVVLKPNKADLGSPALGQGVVYRLKVILRNRILGDYVLVMFFSVVNKPSQLLSCAVCLVVLNRTHQSLLLLTTSQMMV